jgi:hypothetical protein
MLRLNIIVQNPAAESAIRGFDLLILALLVVAIVGLWIAAARGLSRGRRDEADERVSNGALDVLRRLRLVVLPSRKPRGPHAAVVSELEPDEAESEPRGH